MRRNVIRMAGLHLIDGCDEATPERVRGKPAARGLVVHAMTRRENPK